jgi:2,4-dienoyl-CoA reductase-like NADH-dependent reductase (Old Yellow Enzyme family)
VAGAVRSEDDQMTALAQSLRLPCGVELPNRLLKSAMTEGLATPLGIATERHNTLYRRWSAGGVGTLITGNVMVDYRYLERPGNIVFDGNGGEAELAKLAEAGTAHGNQLWMQISHPGRQCTRLSNTNPLAPSPVQLKLGGLFGQPQAMTEDDIRTAIAGYARVAAGAKRAGFTGVQVHGAHGYLLSQFLSPRTNQRDDQWGGVLENRARMLLEAVRAVRAAVGPDFPVSVKLNSADFSKNGFTLEECCQVAQWLQAEGLDLVEISGGTYEDFAPLDGSTRKSESTLAREAYFIQYAEQIRAAVSLPICITGGFRSRSVMDQALADNALDVVGIARPLCVEPDAGHKLLADADYRLPQPEDGLQLGPGFWGPYSSNSLIKALNVQAGVAWFYRNIIAIAEGNDVPEDINALTAYLRHFRDEWKLSRARMRQLKQAGRDLRQRSEAIAG